MISSIVLISSSLSSARARTVWKDDYEFARDLKAEARIAVNPGSNYGDRRSHSPFRVPYLPGEDVLEGICSRLERFMKKNVY